MSAASSPYLPSLSSSYASGAPACTPPSPSRRRRNHRQERHEDTGSGEETEDEEEDGDRDTETPREAPVEFIRVGGAFPPRRKTRTSRTLPLNVCTCCCRKSTETFRTTTMSRTWMGSRGRRHMSALLAPARRTIGDLVCHTLRRSGAPLHGYIGSGMVGVTW